MNVVEGTHLDGEVVATRDPEQEFAGYPLRGEIRAESTALTALPLFVPEIDRSSGILDAARGGRVARSANRASTASSTSATAASISTAPTCSSPA